MGVGSNCVGTSIPPTKVREAEEAHGNVAAGSRLSLQAANSKPSSQASAADPRQPYIFIFICHIFLVVIFLVVIVPVAMMPVAIMLIAIMLIAMVPVAMPVSSHWLDFLVSCCCSTGHSQHCQQKDKALEFVGH